MKKIIMAAAMVLLCVFGQNAAALSAIPTQPTEILPLAPLMITSYQTTAAGTDLAFVGIYNSGDGLIDLRDWQIIDATNNRQLVFSTEYSRYIVPGGSVVLSRVGAVNRATYTIDGWQSLTAGGGVVKIATLRIAKDDAYRAVDVSIKNNDMVQTRNLGTSDYVTGFTEGTPASLPDDRLYEAPVAPPIEIIEVYPYASDCSPFDGSVLCGDYIKLYNPTAGDVSLDDIVLRTDSSSNSRTTSNTITLGGVIAEGGYKTIWLADTNARISLTNSGGYVWLEDIYSLVSPYAGSVVRYESAGSSLQGYAYAIDADGEWQWTSTPRPNEPNVITAPVAAACEEGKYRSPDTGRCRTLEDAINALAACEEGYERNPATNRCRKTASASATALTPCKEGQERNPATNRCRSIASAIAELLPCDEGYERNPATNRCRKAQSSAVLGAEYPVEPYEQQGAALAAWWVIGGIAALAGAYGVWEWRREIAAGLGRLRGAFTSRK